MNHSPKGKIVINLKKVEERYHRIQDGLGNKFKIYYAMKCNSNSRILQKINELGGYFDVASLGELEILNKNNILNLERCLFTNPYKSLTHLSELKNMNISRFVIDSIDEIDKISTIYGKDVEIIVRLNVNNHHCDINLNEKYGINESDIPSILEHIYLRKLNMIGFCFHVGSRNYNESIYTEMIEKCLNYQELMNQYNFKIKLIDIGGGFITTNDDKMDRVFESIREFVEKIKEPIEWITEPGRYMVDDSIDNHCEIIGKRSREERIDYVLDDSAYMNFNHILYDHRKIKESEIELNIQISLDKAIHWCHSRLWGQTCDSHDVILEEIRLPELKIGDVIVFKLSGAYTLFGGGNEFNGFKQKCIELIE